MNCNYNLKDSIRYLNNLNRKEATGRYTVASFETLDPENYDFKTLIEALEWSKQVGATIHSTNSLILELAEGTHMWTQTEILKQGVSDLANDNALTFFTNINIQIAGKGKSNTIIKFDSLVDDVVLLDASILIANVRMKILGTNNNSVINFKGTNTKLFVSNCILDDISFFANINSFFILSGSNEFRNNNNVNRYALYSKYCSFIKCIDADFHDSDFLISSDIDSKIFFINNSNIGQLSFSPEFNMQSNNFSSIFDGAVPVLGEKTRAFS